MSTRATAGSGADGALLAAFRSAFDLALGVLDRADVARDWHGPSALEGFSVGALAAHLYTANRLFEAALDLAPDDGLCRVTLEDFYTRNRVDDRQQLDDEFHRAIRDDAHRRAAQGPDVLVAKFAGLGDRLVSRLADLAPDHPVAVWRLERSATTVADYTASRVVELLVHADDLAASVGDTVELPPDAAAVAFGVCLRLARAGASDLAVLRAFTRRERASPGTLVVF